MAATTERAKLKQKMTSRSNKADYRALMVSRGKKNISIYLRDNERDFLSTMFGASGLSEQKIYRDEFNGMVLTKLIKPYMDGIEKLDIAFASSLVRRKNKDNKDKSWRELMLEQDKKIVVLYLFDDEKNYLSQLFKLSLETRSAYRDDFIGELMTLLLKPYIEKGVNPLDASL